MAYEQGPLWGGLVVYPESTLPQQIPAYVRFVDAIASDPDASLVALNIFDSSSNSSIQANAYVYLKPEPYPAIFRELTSIQPELVNTQRVSPLSDQVNLEGLIPGKRCVHGHSLSARQLSPFVSLHRAGHLQQLNSPGVLETSNPPSPWPMTPTSSPNASRSAGRCANPSAAAAT